MMKIKIVGIIAGVFFGMLVFAGISTGWIGILKTPRIEGQVIDATTGKPIENVVVPASWTAQVLAFPFVDTNYDGVHGETVITDKDGRFVLKAFRRVLIGAHFVGIRASYIHPLYVPINFSDVGGVEDKNGVVHFEIKIISLEEKYLNQVKQMKTAKEKWSAAWDFGATIEAEANGYYWRTLRDNNITFNLEDTFSVWDRIVKYLEQFLNVDRRVNETKVKIKQTLGE